MNIRGPQSARTVSLGRVTAVVMFLVSTVVVVLSLRRPPPDPIHQGRTLTEWLSWSPAPATSRQHEQQHALVAVQAMGSEALPRLRFILESGHSMERRLWQAVPFHLQLRWAPRFFHRQSRLFALRRAALQTLAGLRGTVASPLIPELRHIMADTSEPREIRLFAMGALLNAVGDDLDAVQRVIGVMTNDVDPWIRRFAVDKLEETARRRDRREHAALNAYFAAHAGTNHTRSDLATHFDLAITNVPPMRLNLP